MNNGEKVSISCLHRQSAFAQWKRNDGNSAPILLIIGCEAPTYVVLTNKTILLNCRVCHQTFNHDNRSANNQTS